MNNRPAKDQSAPGPMILFSLMASALLCFAGCRPPKAETILRDFKTPPPHMLHEIKQLNLTPAQPGLRERSPIDPNTPAPFQIEITLEQARAIALENNLDLKAQLISPAIAAERVTEEEAKFEAALFSNLSYSRTDTPTSTTLTGSKVDSSNMNLGVNMPMTTGGTLTFNVADYRVKTNNIFSTLDPAYSSGASVSLSQPLLRNAGTRANTYAIRLAAYDRSITDAGTKLEVIKVIAAVDRLYWQLYAARKELDVRRGEYELAKAQLAQARRFVNQGERAQVEITRAEAGVAQRLEAIILAENTLRDTQRDIKRALNKTDLDMKTATAVIPATEPNPIRYELKQDDLVRTAIEGRMEMLELELRIAQDVSTLDYAKNQALPLATMDYTYNLNGLGGTREKAYDLLYDNRFQDHRFGLQLLVPLGNQAAKSRIKQALYTKRQRLATKESRAATIELEVLNAIDQLEANWQRVLAARQRTILDGRLYEAEKRQYEIGTRTTTDVLLAQTNFADAQSAEIRALAEYQIALVDLAYATGTVLGSAKIRWEPIIPNSPND
ncbi:MAG: TolC family protein [Sedimentisphaerales bacterium]|nr:TolC family protein [Sedimentisphaerales bacterium]